MSDASSDDARLGAVYEERVREQAASHPGYDDAWGRFASTVLSYGGRLVVPPRSPDALVDMLADKGFLWHGEIDLRRGDQSDCHRNAVGLWRSGEAVALATGYALSADGLWREHSWGVGPGRKILETTEARTKYFGVEFSGPDAHSFADWIAPDGEATSASADPDDPEGGRERFVKVVFALRRDEQGWPPVGSEGLWAEWLGGDHYRIDNTPWFVRNLAADDVVTAERDSDGTLWATERVSWSGRLTIRVIPFSAGPLRGDRSAVLDAFEALGVSGEGIESYGIVSLDIPPNVDLRAVKTLLKAGSADGSWDYDEGCVSEEWLDL